MGGNYQKGEVITNSVKGTDMDSNSVNILVAIAGVISSLISIIPAIIYALATFFAAGVAIWGVRSWRSEFRGKRQIELAEDTLELFYNAKDVMNAIRNPISYSDEGSTRKPAENETPEQKESRDTAYIVIERYKKHQDIFNKLHSMRYRFMAQVGKDEAEPFEEIRKSINRVFAAAQHLGELWAKQARTHDVGKQEKLQEQIEKYEAVFCWGYPEDKITERVDKAVEDIEQTCKNIIMKGRVKTKSK